MPVVLQQCGDLPLTLSDAAALWEAVVKTRKRADDHVTVRCVDIAEMQRLNVQYRRKNKPTNVLTFSYETEHDVALCLAVAEQEAEERGIALREYTAQLLTHAFLHAAGLDHERSEAEAQEMRDTEAAVLHVCGFAAL